MSGQNRTMWKTTSYLSPLPTCNYKHEYNECQ